MEYKEATVSDRLCRSFKDDCVIRSIAIGMYRSYPAVFTELMELGLSMGAYPNHDKVWTKYLESAGWTRNKPPRDANGKMIKLLDWQSPPVAIVRNSGHLTVVRDGYLIDTWDCRYRPVNTYWTPI